MNQSPIIRPLNYPGDQTDLKFFLGEWDASRLDKIRPAIDNGECFVLVAEIDGHAAAWAVVHTRYRDDLGWVNPEGDTIEFQSGKNAYLEYLEVRSNLRRQGIGRTLLSAAEQKSRSLGKRVLWLHTSDTNFTACAFYERQGWTHAKTVHPSWNQGAAMRVYQKSLV